MKSLATAFLLVLLFAFTSEAQSIPAGYILQYEQNFSSSRVPADFRFTHPQSWSIARNGNNPYLKYTGDSSYVPEVESPATIGLLGSSIFGDFVMELDVMPLISDSGMRDICILAAVRDSLQYYYIRLADVADSLSNGIFLVNRTTSRRISAGEPRPVTWNENRWHRIRIERDIVKRTFRVFFQDMKVPLMESKDYELVMGYVGFGGFRGSGGFDNIRIWAPTSIPEESRMFEKQ